ncbi:phosphatidate cytidylyltransferase [Wansuia hejianensis]|uniref:Phosphatidate cytidylyltransferase n=1 Tax=Wansuia hejianensis TaxID=2763667 RepID=A0A926INA9_9FIRM|nr:phosphatidate cytidylyltransferase [Wansuia hejianensis]
MKEFSKRVVTGIVGVLLLILIVQKGEFYLATSIFILSLIGLWEFYNALKNINIKPVETIGYLGAIGIFISSVNSYFPISAILTFVTLTLLISLVLNKDTTLQDISATLLSIVYIPFLFSHIYYLDGTKYIWLIFIMGFGTDTFAYIFGHLFGKNKLAPKISPNKTIEGSFGGIIGSLVFTVIFSLYFELEPLWKLVFLAIVVSILSQIGDLVASRIKRLARIKDYGFIMPGHGGVLDRFDSIIFCAPLIYYYVTYFLN